MKKELVNHFLHSLQSSSAFCTYSATPRDPKPIHWYLVSSDLKYTCVVEIPYISMINSILSRPTVDIRLTLTPPKKGSHTLKVFWMALPDFNVKSAPFLRLSLTQTIFAKSLRSIVFNFIQKT